MNRPIKPYKTLTLMPDDDYVGPGMTAETTLPAKTARKWRAQRAELGRPQPANFLDPVTVALTVDILLRLAPESRITAKALTSQMHAWYPQILWDQYNVGRILSGIAEAASGSGAPADALPLASYRSSGTRQYVVNANLKNWRWLLQARHNLGQLAEDIVNEDRKAGRPVKPAEFPWGAFSHQWGS